jgi:hypothetical protein
VKTELVETYGQGSFFALSCFYYDSWLATATTFDFALTLGNDFEDPTEFRRMYKDVRLTGCSGAIRFEKDSNNRDLMPFDIQNLQYKEGFGLQMINVGFFNPIGSTVWTWYD